MNKSLVIFNIILLLVATIVCITIGFFFSMLVDFFPWGSKKSYVIWEPLILWYIIPSFLFIGLFKFILNKNTNLFLFRFSFFLAGILLLVPSLIGFDLESDIIGRWAGIFSSIILLIIFLVEAKLWLRIPLARPLQKGNNK